MMLARALLGGSPPAWARVVRNEGRRSQKGVRHKARPTSIKQRSPAAADHRNTSVLLAWPCLASPRIVVLGGAGVCGWVGGE